MEEEQLNQFIVDMLEMSDKGGYYYGHFILESSNETFEIIDGQQRITSFILFLMVCKLYKNHDPIEDWDNKYIEKFKTVDYDNEDFEEIKKKLTNTEWKLADFKLSNNPTLSIQRIMFALNYFRKLFTNGISGLKLDFEKIDCYIKTFTEALISTHITDSKSVAVQIFELQNTRGIKLSLIEKVKSKLMKVIYVNAAAEERDDIIEKIQNNFAEIYRLEESVSSKAFRGNLTLEDILLHHLRIVDDGTKLTTEHKNNLNTPDKYGDKEKSILNYLDSQIRSKNPESVVQYVSNLSIKLEESVRLVSEVLPRKDEQNKLIGDVLILDKSLSLEFFILLSHKNYQKDIENEKIVRLWERLLFTRDFHDNYYKLKYRDDFETLFYRIAKNGENVEEVLNDYVNNSFIPDKMEGNSLIETVSNYIEENETNILTNAFNWQIEKMVYVLYKYEIAKDANLTMLREIMKKGRSVEHILPQGWKWEWIGEDHQNISAIGKTKNEKVQEVINGIGNLLLITVGENSSISNNHPAEKTYKTCIGGTYKNHELNKKEWNDCTKWEEIIAKRGESIFEFLQEFIK